MSQGDGYAEPKSESAPRVQASVPPPHYLPTITTATLITTLITTLDTTLNTPPLTRLQAEELLSDGVEFILAECDKNGDGVIDRDELLPMIGHWLDMANEWLDPPPPEATRWSDSRKRSSSSVRFSDAKPDASSKYLVKE